MVFFCLKGSLWMELPFTILYLCKNGNPSLLFLELNDVLYYSFHNVTVLIWIKNKSIIYIFVYTGFNHKIIT